MDDDKPTYEIIGAAMEVHRELGPGYLEAVYHESLEIAFQIREIPYVSHPQMTIEYKDRILQKYYIPDFLVFGAVPVEIKAHSAPLTRTDGKQIINSLKCCKEKVGLLINFGRDPLDYKRFMS